MYNTKTRIIGNLLGGHDLLCKHNDFRQHFLMFIFLWYLHFQVAFLDMQRRLDYVNLCQHLLGSRCDYESIRYWRMKFVITRSTKAKFQRWNNMNSIIYTDIIVATELFLPCWTKGLWMNHSLNGLFEHRRVFLARIIIS